MEAMSDGVKLSLEARLEIMELLARYARAVDTGDLDAYVNAFAPDGVLFSKHHGHEQIRAFMGQVMRDGRAGPMANGDVVFRHFVGQPVIDWDGSTATVHSYLLWINLGPNPPISAAAEYRDTCVEVDGRWVFQTRDFTRVAGVLPAMETLLQAQSGQATG
jgi:uncharacterized protein (TIGR02246 family)